MPCRDNVSEWLIFKSEFWIDSLKQTVWTDWFTEINWTIMKL